MADEQGCGWYRIALPLQQLRQHGHTITMGTNLADQRWGQAAPDRPDVLIGQRVHLPGPSALWSSLAARPGPMRPALVYEIDDDPFSVPPDNPAYGEFRAQRANFERNLAAADLVTVSTYPLAEVARRYNPNVVVLPNCVPSWLVDIGDARLAQPVLDVPIVGWAGSPTHLADWRGSGAAAGVAHAMRRGAAGLHLIGQGARSVLAGHKVPGLRESGWLHTTAAHLRRIDFTIGLAPLVDNAFNRSKSDIKILEYAALGIPWIASGVGPYETSPAPGMRIPGAGSPLGWRVAVRSRIELAYSGNDFTSLRIRGLAWARGCLVGDHWFAWERAYRRAMAIRDARL
ncbi:MAG: hypothetical protein OEW44_00090 [Gemmatimonadota bacterium]|nr:hypothetical protein [Gemmatimonadota bacterium]